jgi:hypothetical protein
MTPAELIAAYADDPASLTADERRAVEELCARDAEAATALDEARAALGALREARPAFVEPDWAAMQARIGEAVRRDRRRRGMMIGAALAAAAAIVLVVALGARQRPGSTTAQRPDAMAAEPELTEDELAAELDVPDDLGGITVDDALIDEAAALGDEPDEGGEPERLLPDATWIDELSDEELDRAVEILAQEAT